VKMDYTLVGYAAALVVVFFAFWTFIKKPNIRRRAIKRLTDKDIRIGRKSYNLLNIATILFAAAGFATIAAWIPGWTQPEWMPHIVTYGLLGGVILLLVDAIKE